MESTSTVVDAPVRQLVALEREYTLETRHEIPQLWDDFWSRSWPCTSADQACYGASYAVQDGGRFRYAVGIPVSPLPNPLPPDACIVTLSPGRYRVFRNRGPVSELPKFFDHVFTAALPATGDRQREGAVFERYPFDDSATPASLPYEIWVPIE